MPNRTATAWTIKQISIQENLGNSNFHPPTSLKHQCCTIHAVQQRAFSTSFSRNLCCIKERHH